MADATLDLGGATETVGAPVISSFFNNFAPA